MSLFEKAKHCDICGIITFTGKLPHEPDSEDCKNHQKYNDDHATCGTYETTCPCSDCEVYFRKGVNRPIIGNNISEEEKNLILDTINSDEIKLLMLSEWLRSSVFENTPYHLWKQTNESFYKVKQKMLDSKDEKILEQANKVEICEISNLKLIDIDKKTHNQYSVSYRYPECTVKFELSIDKDSGKISTHSTGINYFDKL